MDEHQHHDNLIQSVTEEYQEIFLNSEQAVYIYFDDQHKACNKNFASLLGYESEEEWAKVEDPFPEVFVADESQEALVSSFQDVMEKNVASTNTIVWKKKDGGTVEAAVIIVPISHDGHLFALHFVTSK